MGTSEVMELYGYIAAVTFIALWLVMVWKVSVDASDSGALLLALSFIPLFTMGVAMAAIAWPLSLVALAAFGLARLSSHGKQH